MDLIVSGQKSGTYSPAVVKFDKFEYYKEQANEIANYINTTVLTNDNIKEVKKDLADARKVVKGLDKIRIELKKELLVSFNDFEKQVKEIQGIIDQADSKLRDQVRAIEENERQIKEANIRVIWDARICMYDIDKYINEPFYRWLQPAHLNKTTSLKKAETDMTEWMEAKQKDIDMILTFDNADIILAEYVETLDVSMAIKIVNDKKKLAEQMREQIEDADSEDSALFLIKGKSNINYAIFLLKENGIKFEVK